MAQTVYMYDVRDFSIDFRNGDNQTVYTSAPTGDDQSGFIPYSQTITGGTLSMGGTRADLGTLDISFTSSPVDTAVENDSAAVVETGKTLFGDTSIATGETLHFIYEIRIYDPANPTEQIYLYAVARSDTYNGGADDDQHEIVGFATSVPLDPNVSYVVGDVYGSDLQAVREDQFYPSALVPDPANPVCFAAGTRILTQRGEVPVEELAIGDMVFTLDRGLQPLRWINARKFQHYALSFAPHMRPIRICRGALGEGLPAQDLTVSPQHRILVRSKIAERMFGKREVLVAAKQLLSIDGIEIAEDLDEVTYFHFAFSAHEIVIANGTPAESLYFGEEALKSIPPAARDELLSIFPEIANMQCTPQKARAFVPGRLGRKLASRHHSNAKALIEFEGARHW